MQSVIRKIKSLPILSTKSKEIIPDIAPKVILHHVLSHAELLRQCDLLEEFIDIVTKEADQ
jgi:hypothetical protein